MIRRWFVLLLIPFSGACQTVGIHFEIGTSWDQVVRRAQNENKLIFVDCFATWCGPCKEMDRTVYPTDTVGGFMNAHFISVKLQMDTSRMDDSSVKRWYGAAHEFRLNYNVDAYPTFLFFSTDGKIVHKEIGMKTPGEFLLTAANAIDPGKQYFTLLQAYRQGSRNYFVLPYLAKSAQRMEDNGLALELAREYIRGYLDKLSADSLNIKDNLDFLGNFHRAISSKDSVFGYIYKNADKIDARVQIEGFSIRMVEDVITREEIEPSVIRSENGGPDPDWNAIKNVITRKYNSKIAGTAILQSKPSYYKYKKDWKNYTKYLVILMEENGIGKISTDMWGAIYLNNNAWEIFEYSSNIPELEKALAWSQRAVEMDTSYLAQGNLDTYANILYKLGRNREAIAAEEKALSLKPSSKDIIDTLDKMKKGIPTWTNNK